MNQTRDPELLAPLSFLRQREIVHYERFKELYEEYVKILSTRFSFKNKPDFGFYFALA